MNKLLGNLSQGLVFVLSAPAGTGKTTLVRMLADEFPSVTSSISCTTRAPRPGEIDGRDYYFLKEKEFEERIQEGAFLEYARVFDHYYGTSKEFVMNEQKKGRHVILVIDTQGAMQLRASNYPAILIFISPPSLPVLRERLFHRKTENPQHIEKRLSWAERELSMLNSYDYHIVNDNLHHAYDILRSILIAEEHRVERLEAKNEL